MKKMKRRTDDIYLPDQHDVIKIFFPGTVVSLAVNMCSIWYTFSK